MTQFPDRRFKLVGQASPKEEGPASGDLPMGGTL